MKRAKFASAVVAAMGLALTGTASALPVLYSPITQFNDQNIDYANDIGAGNTGTLGVGDELISVFQLSQTLGIPTGGPSALGADSGNPGNNLVGIADVTITAVLGDGTLVFTPTSTLGTGINLLGSYSSGTAVALFTGSTLDTIAGTNDILNSNCGTRAQCIADVTDGNLYMTAGFFGDPDESWVSAPANGGTTLSTVEGGNSQTSYGSFNFQLSIGINNTGSAFGESISCAPFCGAGGNGLVDLSGNGTIYGGQGLDPADWTARSKTGFQVAPVSVPDPTTVALLGLGLAGLGWMQRRQKA